MTSQERADLVVAAWSDDCALCGTDVADRFWLAWIDARTSEKICTHCGHDKNYEVMEKREILLGGRYYPPYRMGERIVCLYDAKRRELINGMPHLSYEHVLIPLD